MAKGASDSDKFPINLSSFIGGEATDFKFGTASSFYSSLGLDFRSKISQMSLLPGNRVFSTNLRDLPLVMLQDPNGVRYLVGDAGYIYKITTAGVLVLIGQLNSAGGAGAVYNQQSDQIYIAGQQTISLYGQLTNGTPQLRLDAFGASASVANAVIYIFDENTLSYDGGTVNGVSTQRNNLNSLTQTGVTPGNYASLVTNSLTNTYSLPSTISEDSGQFCPFIPDIEPFYGVAVYVDNVGTGNWMLTMHDSLNNDLGSVTITNANIVQGWNLFTFTAPGIRALINPVANGTGGGNHFHLTSSVSNDTATVATINQGDLTGCNMVLFAYRMIQTHNSWHPMLNFNQYLCIGNGPYLSTYNYANDADPNNLQYVRHQLILDVGYEVTSLCSNSQYICVAAEKRTNNTTTHNYQDGYLYFWDGISATFSFKIEIPMGSPYSVFSQNNIIYFYCAGSLFAYGGGQTVLKVRYMAFQNTDYLGTSDTTIVNPNMMDMRYNLLMMAYPSTTTNINTFCGVYSWGSVELIYPNSFGQSYALSNNIQNETGTNNLKIGMIKNFVDTMFTSWEYTDANAVVHYGLDILDPTSTAAPNFNWTSLIWDGGVRYKQKNALRYKVSFLPLPANTTITAWYSLNRGAQISADPTTNTSYSASTGATDIMVEIDKGRFFEAQWGFYGTTNGATTPLTITGVTMEIDPLESEVDLKEDNA